MQPNRLISAVLQTEFHATFSGILFGLPDRPKPLLALSTKRHAGLMASAKAGQPHSPTTCRKAC